MADGARSRFLLLGGLYFAQGVPWGFVTVALALRFAGLGMGPVAMGEILAVAQIPWTAKPLLAPLVDRAVAWGVGRRPLLLATEAAMALTLLALASVDPRAAMPRFLVLVFAHNACAAGQDVVSDALALALLPADERGRASGVMSAGKYAGVLAGGPGLAWVASQAGWGVATTCAAVLLLLPAALVLFAREPPTAATAATAPGVLGEALRSFAARAAVLGALFALVCGASNHFLYPLVFPLVRQKLGLSTGQVSLLVSLASATTAAGALVGGVLADRLGRRGAIAGAAIALALAHAGFALAFAAGLVQPRPFEALLGYQIASALAGGALYSSTLALFMDLTNPRVAATQFQVYMALLNLRGVWAPLVGGRLAAIAPAPAVFGAGAAIEILALALLPLLSPRAAVRSRTLTR